MDKTVTHLSSDSDERVRSVELLISNLLRGGVMTSLIFMLAGIILSFIDHPSYLTSPSDLVQLTSPSGTIPHTPQEIESGLLHFQGQVLITIGLIILFATPVLRVGVSILAFIYQGNRVFTLITLLVLCLLLLSLFLGKGG